MSHHVLPAEASAASPASRRPKIDGVAYLFVAFFTVPFVLFNVLPVVFGFYLAFTNWSIVGTPTFVHEGIELTRIS